jgi:hypothetical protein
MRHYNVLTLAVYRLTHEAGQTSNASRSGRKWLKAADAGVQAGKAWGNYRKNLPRTAQDVLPTPTAQELAPHLDEAHIEVRRQTVVLYASMFETFVQCWSLNYLLSCLEGGRPWSKAERSLAEAFSPEHGSSDLPGLPRVLISVPEIQDGLGEMPAFMSKEDASVGPGAVSSDEPTVLEAVRFWRAVRNLVVHRAGVVNLRFVHRHSRFFEWLKKRYPYMKDLKTGRVFPFYDDVVRAVFAVHSHAARCMSEHLERASGLRRGHPLSPGPKQDNIFFPGTPPPAPMMLLPGDHELSVQWVSTEAFRSAFRAGAPRDSRRRVTRQ